MKNYLKTTTTLMTAAAVSLFATTASSAMISDYDKDHDRTLNSREFVMYSYDLLDVNDDNYIDTVEWDRYSKTFYAPYSNLDAPNLMVMKSYDIDKDGRLDEAEYANAVDTALFNAWDTNNDAELSYLEIDEAEEKYTEHTVSTIEHYDF